MIESQGTMLNVVMEHFSFEMQHLLDGYQDGSLDMDQLELKYNEIGTEGHNIRAYQDLFDHARDNKEQVKLHAGFIPRTFARTLMKQG